MSHQKPGRRRRTSPIDRAHAHALDVLVGETLRNRTTETGKTTSPRLDSLRRREAAPQVTLDEAIECVEHDGSAPGVAGRVQSVSASELPSAAICPLDGSLDPSLVEILIED